VELGSFTDNEDDLVSSILQGPQHVQLGDHVCTLHSARHPHDGSHRALQSDVRIQSTCRWHWMAAALLDAALHKNPDTIE
jgi:hypothetical protein